MSEKNNHTNRFELSIAVAKRARQLQEGAVPLVTVAKNNHNPLLIAYQEFQENKLQIVRTEEKKENFQSEIDEFEALIENTDSSIDKVVEAKEEAEPKKKKK